MIPSPSNSEISSPPPPAHAIAAALGGNFDEKIDWKGSVRTACSILLNTSKLVTMISLWGTAMLLYFRFVMMDASKYEHARAEDGHPAEAFSTLWRQGPATEALDTQEIFVYIAGFFVNGFLSVLVLGWIAGMAVDWQSCGEKSGVYRSRFLWNSLFWSTFYGCCIVIIGYEEFTAPPVISTLLIVSVAWIVFIGVSLVVIRTASSLVLATGLARTIIWGSLTTIGADLYLKRVAAPGFFSGNLLERTIFRFLFVPWRAISVGICTRLALNIQASDGSDTKVVRGHFLHCIGIPVMVITTFSARLLQVGGVGFWEGVMMEVIAISLEFIEIHDLTQLKTTVDQVIDGVTKCFKKKEERVERKKHSVFVSNASDNGRPLTMREVTFAYLILDSMVSEASTSILAVVTLLVFRINMDPKATGFEPGSIIANGIVSTLGELIISDFLVLLALTTYYQRRPDSLGGQRLFSIWDDQTWGFRRSWIIITLGIVASVAPYFVRFLCPAFDEDGDLFHRACSQEVNEAALQFGETGIYRHP